jgi:imidazole glycerol-phosphate synthase subunit HisF
MRPIRVIARLDVKGETLVKTIQLEGLRKVGDPKLFADKYYHTGADEIIYFDIVASLYRRSNLNDIVLKTTRDVFIPVSAGGGLRSISDCNQLLQAGADKITINTFSVENPQIIFDISQRFGSQATVLSIEAKYSGNGKYEVYTDCGREASGKDIIDWFKEAQSLGIGEVVITSIDREGGQRGYDTELINKIAKVSHVPIISSGGFGIPEHAVQAANSGADAVAIAHGLHYKKVSVSEIKKALKDNSFEVRI